MKTKLENTRRNSISRMFGFCLFLISNSILTAVKYNSESYFGNMQFHGSILHPVIALGGGEKKKKNPNPRARKVSICQLSEGILFENPSSQGKRFNIVHIQRPGNHLTAEVQRAVVG